MSKEIDFSKAPEGATHYYLENEDDHFAWAKYVDGKIYIYVQAWDDFWTLYTDFHGDHPIKIPAAWSIYTNDKPLSELSDEQAAALFNAWRGGAKVELLADNCDWCNAIPDWSNDIVYRIKQKSERELLVEECYKAAGQEPLLTGIGFKDAYGKLFDSGKFKLVEQPK